MGINPRMKIFPILPGSLPKPPSAIIVPELFQNVCYKLEAHAFKSSNATGVQGILFAIILTDDISLLSVIS